MILIEEIDGEFYVKFSDLTKKRRNLVALVEERCRKFTKHLSTFNEKHKNPTEYLCQNWMSVLPVNANATGENPIDVLKMHKGFDICCKSIQSIQSRDVEYGEYVSSPKINNLLKSKNIRLYSHQANAIQSLKNGNNVIITTSTSSGKSLVYQTVVYESFLNDNKSTALLIFPTKALAQDQKQAFSKIFPLIDIQVFDGDVQEGRKQIKDTANCILTNPDMVHLSLLPHHQSWSRFFENLKYIVLDEFHYYKKNFARHVSLIMRRLQRILTHYNVDPRIICCSATIANPLDYMKDFFGTQNNQLIENDGSPQSKKDFVVWDPQSRAGYQEASSLLSHLVQNGIKTLVFAQTRLTCELVLNDLPEEIRQLVHSYRGGYTALERRQIEKSMFSGQVSGIISTNALEVGIDIGSIDCVIHVGYPFNSASFHQQAGRCGRRQHESLSILIADGILEQQFIKNPGLLLKQDFDLPSEPDPQILLDHLTCAAKDLPMKFKDLKFFCNELEEDLMEHLQYDKTLNAYLPHQRYRGNPSSFINIRGKTEELFYIRLSNTLEVLEIIELDRVPFMIYLESIILHRGKKYKVDFVNMERLFCLVVPVQVDYICKPRDKTVYITKTDKVSNGIHQGPVDTVTSIYGYHHWNPKTLKIVGSFEMPPQKVQGKTFGAWIEVPEMPSREALHALCHAIRKVATVYLQTDASVVCPPIDYTPRILFIGDFKFMELIYDIFPTLVARVGPWLSNCDCGSICHCVMIDGCKFENLYLDKLGALQLAESLAK